MDAQDLTYQTKRITAYHKLNEELAKVDMALSTLSSPFGAHQVSAFTGNTRESRCIEFLTIGFSKTLGGEKEERLTVPHLNVEAGQVGAVIKALLDTRKAEILKKMREL